MGVKEKAADPGGYIQAEREAVEQTELEILGYDMAPKIDDGGPVNPSSGSSGENPAPETTDTPKKVEDDKPPRPIGDGDYKWHNGRWCKARADGRLMEVDSAGCFIRRLKNPSPYARPYGVLEAFWQNLKPSEQRELVKEKKAEAAEALSKASKDENLAYAGPAIEDYPYRTFTVKLPNRSSSTFPPWE